MATNKNSTNNDKSLELQTLGTADDELEYHTDNDSEQENSDCETIHETVCIRLHDTLPTNSLEEKQPKQSEEMAAKQYGDKKEKVEEKKIDADKAETKAARNEERNLERERIGFKLRRKTLEKVKRTVCNRRKTLYNQSMTTQLTQSCLVTHC